MATKIPLSHRFQSTRVDAATYDPDRAEISVVFVDGVAWKYRRADRRTWLGFIRAGSAGRYIKDTLDLLPNGPA
jgi:hypothetical protein